MSESKGKQPVGASTAEIPVIRPGAVPAPETVQAQEPTPPEGELPPGAQGTAPVTVRPRPRMPRRGPMTIMGPWAPVAGGVVGLLLGGVVAAVLGGVAETFDQRLALVFVVLALGMLGTAGTLLADEVQVLRQRTREATVRPQWVEATAGLVNGLTPARLLLVGSVVVLVLAAWLGRG